VRSGAAPPRVAFMLDLPRAETPAFPPVESDAADEVALYDYSSDITGPDVAWSVGQRRPTHIYRHVLRFRPDGDPREAASPLEAPLPVNTVAPPRG